MDFLYFVKIFVLRDVALLIGPSVLVVLPSTGLRAVTITSTTLNSNETPYLICIKILEQVRCTEYIPIKPHNPLSTRNSPNPFYFNVAVVL